LLSVISFKTCLLLISDQPDILILLDLWSNLIPCKCPCNKPVKVLAQHLSDRTKFKRYVSVPHKNRDTFTLPRQVTDPNIKHKADNKKQEPESIEHNNKTSENGADTKVEQESAVTETKESQPEITKPRLVSQILCSRSLLSFDI